MNRTTTYWLLQLGGWFSFFAAAALYNVQLVGIGSVLSLYIDLGIVCLGGLLLSHAYRELIHRLGWNKMGILPVTPRALLASLVLAILVESLRVSTMSVILPNSGIANIEIIISDVLSLFVVFLLWSLIYFAAAFFQNYRQAEIKNLRMQATMNEIELNKIKSQLNPHFMFNAMNSIKALVDEDPAKAKVAVTQLSNILRTTLLLGKRKRIPFDEEIGLVQDYIGIESARYEERLRTNLFIEPECSRFQVPPLMLQTLVENAIKHGISLLPNGGELGLRCTVSDNMLHMRVSNPGAVGKSPKAGTGFGLKNTQQRLDLLYGSAATFNFYADNGTVISEVLLPEATKQTPKTKSIN